MILLLKYREPLHIHSMHQKSEITGPKSEGRGRRIRKCEGEKFGRRFREDQVPYNWMKEVR